MLFRNSLRHFVCASAFVLSLTLLPAACQAQPASPSTGRVKPGIEVLQERGFDVLQGKRIGLLTNPSGVDRHLRPTIDILCQAPGVQLVRLFGPEHGVRGDAHAGDPTADLTDAATGLICYSLYG